MRKKSFPARKFLAPVAAYVLLVAVIILSRPFLSYSHYVALSAGAMLAIPFAFDRRSEISLRFSFGKFANGAAISLGVLFLYLVCFFLLALHMGKTIDLRKLPPDLILTHLVAFAFAEEFFFRGYLQRKLGGGLRSVVAASVMFAMAHFFAICLFGKGGACVQNLLTFFPSLVMGYLYLRTGTLWASVFFHFAANMVYLSVRMV